MELGRLGLVPESIPGYEREEYTHLAVAADMLRELGMTYWLERLDLDRVGPPAAALTG